MTIRRVAKTVATSVAAVACAGAGALAFAGTAGAATEIPNALQPVSGTFTAGTPFDSGQQVDVVVPANSVLTAGSTIYLLECAAPGGVLPTSTTECDGDTGYAGGTIKAGTGGSVDLKTDTPSHELYPIYALPDNYSLGETSSNGAVCDLGDECVVYIGEGGGGDVGMAQPHVFSTPFVVSPDPTDSGTIDPGDGTPEVPLAIGLPLLAAGIFGGTVVVRRRRRSSAGVA